MKYIVFIFLGIIYSTTALAQPPDLIGTLGFGYGGDELIADSSEEDWELESGIHAGGASSIKLGMTFLPLDSSPNFELQVTLGWKAESLHDYLPGIFHIFNAGDARFARYPVDVIAFYNFHTLRCGTGLTYHINPKLSGGKVPSELDGDFDNAFGGMLQVDYLLRNLYLVGINYEIIKYKSATGSYNGNNISMFMGIRF